MARCKTCPWRETSWEIRTCLSHRKTTIRLQHGMTLTFRVCTRVKDLIYWSQKVLLSDIFVPKVKRLKLNFSKEKSKFALIMLLYRFFLLPVLVSICAKYFENFPEIHLYSLEILFSEISEY